MKRFKGDESMNEEQREEQREKFDARVQELIEGHFFGWEIDKKNLPPELARLFTPLAWNLLEWIPCGKADTVVEIGGHYGEYSARFADLAGALYVYEADPRRAELVGLRCGGDGVRVFTDRFEDFLEALPGNVTRVVFHDIGFFGNVEALCTAMRTLRARYPDCLLILPCENPNGLRFSLAGIEEPAALYPDRLLLSLDTLTALAQEAGCAETAIYYPCPETAAAMLLFSDRSLPKADQVVEYCLNKLADGFDRDSRAEFFATKEAIAQGRFREKANSYLLLAGPLAELDLPVFVKYSNERADFLKVRTEIRPGQWVRKIAVDKSGCAHIQRLYRFVEHARRQYAGTALTLPEASVTKYVYSYPFIEGKTLMQELDDALQKGRREFLDLLGRWQQQIRRAHDSSYFCKTRNFMRVFGNENVPAGLRCGDVNNIDLVFDNIILNGDDWVVIDTEWTFDFPIPVDFILYRAFFYYAIRRELDKKLLASAWKLLGIDPELQAVFHKLELHFQAYILGGNMRFLR